jgi:hypothetical protein
MNRRLLHLFAAGVTACVLYGATASAAVVTLLQDDFESYPLGSSAQFDAAWPLQVTGPSTIEVGLGTNTSQVVYHPANGTTATARRQQSFANTVPTASEPIEWSFDFYDTQGAITTSYRQYGELYANTAGGALAQLLAMGVNSTATAGVPTPGGTAETWNAQRYQARIAFGGGSGWFNLQAERSVGWHNFKALIYDDRIDYYVNGVFDTSFTNTAATVGVADGYNQARIGSGLSSQFGGAYYDNVLVQVIPEPASLSLLALAGLGMIRRRRA